jgi:hypothetical protein
MAANAIPAPELKGVPEKKTDENCVPVSKKQRLEKVLREVFEGREEYLGCTPD